MYVFANRGWGEHTILHTRLLLDNEADALLRDNSGRRAADMIHPHSRIPEMPIWSRLSPGGEQ